MQQQIQKLNENESDLLRKNNALKEEMLGERDKFLAELNRESTSKQNLLEQLTSKIKEQEEIRQREKLDLVEHLKSQVEYFKIAKDKVLNYNFSHYFLMFHLFNILTQPWKKF